ncbi:MAG: class I SAM-dependent RNA methyltransferase [Pyrinomonadaceae bacterium]
MSKGYLAGQTIDVSIEKIVPNGFGMAFAENLTVFVPLAVPGDRLRVRINQIKGKTAFAEIERIVDPSKQRVDPPCQYFGRCGGCDFQQMPYPVQLEAKIEIIRDCLRRIGKIDFPDEIRMIPSPKPFGYRTRAQWHLETRRKKTGYYGRNSNRVIDVETCSILSQELQGAFEELRKNIDWQAYWSETVRIEASAAGGEVSLFSDEIIEPTREIEFQLDGNRYFFNANTFFQGNFFLIGELTETALAGAEGEKALDLYCGVGLFTLPLAKKFGTVIGVEASDRAVDFAEKNAAVAGLENIGFYRRAVSDFLVLNPDELKEIDFVVLDPPRSGTEKGVIEGLIGAAPRRISYVSCEPSILARDLRILEAGGYRIESITAIDLFPQTHHIETVVRMEKSSG